MSSRFFSVSFTSSSVLLIIFILTDKPNDSGTNIGAAFTKILENMSFMKTRNAERFLKSNNVIIMFTDGKMTYSHVQVSVSLVWCASVYSRYTYFSVVWMCIVDACIVCFCVFMIHLFLWFLRWIQHGGRSKDSSGSDQRFCIWK